MNHKYYAVAFRSRLGLIAAATLIFSGCASTADIDMSRVESQCGRACTANYSECLDGFTLFPIMAQHECTDALRLCAQSCPAKSEQAQTQAAILPPAQNQ
jgi:hypothetical protein